MKIEKINDSQIRFILTEQDLEARQIKLSELAYGTEKAKNLFREMLQQAASQFNFDVNNIPIMVEAVPMRSGTIVLIVTKVDNPEELDTRFSSFAPAVHRASMPGETGVSSFDQLLDSIMEQQESGTSNDKSVSSANAMKDALNKFRGFAVCNRLYQFASMDDVIRAASLVRGSFTGRSMLFREGSHYCLFLIMKDQEEVSAMQYVLSVMSEYGTAVPVSYARQQYLEEHGDALIPEGALDRLAEI